LTFTNYHPEHWQPAWTSKIFFMLTYYSLIVRNILQALVSFMPVEEENLSVGAMMGSKEER
jgi:hypothetical protein